MNDLSREVICERTRNFIKYVYDTYENPQVLTKMLELLFKKKGIICGFTWVPGEEYFGEINVLYISSNDIIERKRRILQSAKNRDILSNKLLLHDFIYHFWNPEGILLIEKIRFELEG
jgi:hypothetical protein